MSVDLLKARWSLRADHPGVIVADLGAEGAPDLIVVDGWHDLDLPDEKAATIAAHIVELHNARLSSHPDDDAVDRAAILMKAKMAAGRAKGYGGWDDPARCSVQTLTGMLVEHIGKGDPIDVLNLAMMLALREGGAAAMKAAIGIPEAPLHAEPAQLVERLTRRGAHDVRLSEILIDLGHRDLAEMVARAAKLLVEAGMQLGDRMDAEG